MRGVVDEEAVARFSEVRGARVLVNDASGLFFWLPRWDRLARCGFGFATIRM